jgi:transcriptional regulator with XRE-family HTH domain
VTPVKLRTRFGQIIRRRRLLAQIGQEALADTAKIHRTHLSLIERGQRMPTIYVVHQLATALKTTMVDLMRDVESNEPLGEEPPPLPRGRPRKKKRVSRKAIE